MPDKSVHLVMTSPPYALHHKKAYGNASKSEYVEWFLPFAKEIFRVLKDDGSFVLNIGGSYKQGSPNTLHLPLQATHRPSRRDRLPPSPRMFWYNSEMPVQQEWVTVRRIRVKDSVEFVWWLSKTEWAKGQTNRNDLRPYSEDMKRLNKKGLARRADLGATRSTRGLQTSTLAALYAKRH